MISVLFEAHQLYYLPHFAPIIAEQWKRDGYHLAASIPTGTYPDERETFATITAGLKVQMLTGDTEEARVRSLLEAAFDVVIVGNAGQLRKVVPDDSLAVMIYHGTGLKVDAEGNDFLSLITETNGGSWGHPMNHYWWNGRYEIAPDVSRIQNIGADDGKSNPGGAWHYTHLFKPVWMGNGKHAPPDSYTLVSTEAEVEPFTP